MSGTQVEHRVCGRVLQSGEGDYVEKKEFRGCECRGPLHIHSFPGDLALSDHLRA